MYDLPEDESLNPPIPEEYIYDCPYCGCEIADLDDVVMVGGDYICLDCAGKDVQNLIEQIQVLVPATWEILCPEPPEKEFD